MAYNESELSIITKAKELCKYVFLVTQKSPKQFRFTFSGRMQNLVLSIMENLIRANDTPLKKGDDRHNEIRYEFQCHAMTDIKILAYFSMLAMENGCILAKQYEYIAKLATESSNLLGAWINSDRDRVVRYCKAGSWWLRSPGNNANNACNVNNNGNVNSNGNNVNNDNGNDIGVRPALFQ